MKLLLPTGRFFLIASLCLFFSACFKDKVTRTYTIQTPVFASKAEVLAGISAKPAQQITETGKVYWLGSWIFMSDPTKGVHIIDNSNPASPKPRAFISLPGNIDIAVKGTTLYADLYTDLLVLDISDPLEPTLEKTIPNVFPDRAYVNGYYIEADKVVVDWIKKDTTVATETDTRALPGFGCMNCSTFELFASSVKGSDGKGGSMARLAVVHENLYLVNSYRLTSFDISYAPDPIHQADVNLGWGIETIYPFKDKLFIGSNTGMFIADIQNPAQPQLLGSFSHARACDPVVADDDFAYVTLRTGNTCVGTLNQLDIVDVRNVMQPVLVKSFPMTNPHGLGLKDPYVYICDGDGGLKVFDVTDKTAIKQKQRLDVKDAFDIIIKQNHALVVGKKGLYQYKIKADGTLQFISLYTLN